MRYQIIPLEMGSIVERQIFQKMLAILIAIIGFSKIGNLSGNLALSILPILIII